MEPKVNIPELIAAIEAKYEKDEKHIALFQAAVADKVVKITQQQVSKLDEFVTATYVMTAKWVHKATHLGIADLEGGDPFAELRQEIRMFARIWVLDPAFVTALG